MEKIYSLPCLYGVGCYSNYGCANAFVNKTGKIQVISNRGRYYKKLFNIFFIRGIIYLFYGLYLFIKDLVQSPSIYKQGQLAKKTTKLLNVSYSEVLYFCVALCAIFLSVFLLGFLPVKFSILLSGYNYNLLLKKFIVAIIKLIIILLTFLILKFIPAFKQFYRFNASSNLIINKQNQINDYYYPLNFINFLLLSFIVCNFFVSIIGFTTNIVLSIFLNLLVCLTLFGFIYELLNVLAKSKIKFFRKLSIITLWFITEKPFETEISVANTALSEVLLMQNKKRDVINESKNPDEIEFSFVYAEIKEKFKQANIDEPSDIDWLLCECLNVKRSQLKLLKYISLDNYKYIQNCTARRLNHEPITKIFGRTEFYGLDFIVTKDVLSPRIDTEILVEKAIQLINKKCKVLDIGTGSGAIAISIAKNTMADVTAVDISDKALNVAKQNAKNNDVKINFKKSNIYENLKNKKIFDIIISNPPYIKSSDIKMLDEEVKDYDPILALDGGESGLEFYERIIRDAYLYLKDKGYILFEVGFDQAKQVKKLLSEKFEDIKIIKDFNKIDRVVVATLKQDWRKNVRTNKKI